MQTLPLITKSARLLALCALLGAIPGTSAWAECPIPADEFEPDPTATSEFLLDHCRFKAQGTNPFFILQPGYQIVLESDEELQVITVLNRTLRVQGVKTRVVEEMEYEKDGDELVPVERSLNFMAICRKNNSVMYFGEDVEDFDEDGNVISHEGEWRAGRNGARPGVVMPGSILIGGSYYEEIAPEDEALDKGTIVSIDDGCEAGDHAFEQKCVRIVGTSDCDLDDEEEKLYADGVGIVQDEDLEIVSWGFVPGFGPDNGPEDK